METVIGKVWILVQKNLNVQASEDYERLRHSQEAVPLMLVEAARTSAYRHFLRPEHRPGGQPGAGAPWLEWALGLGVGWGIHQEAAELSPQAS